MNRHSTVAGAFALGLGTMALTLSMPVAQAQATEAQARGEVVRVDAAAGKIAVRHGAISALDLPAMTLVYHVDPALLQGVAAGDRIQFTARRSDGQYQIVALKK